MTNISPHDWEALSTYLDGQLSSKQQAQIESRLQASPDLRQALEELSQTRSLLRSAPKQRAPRNFTLTPEMAGIRQGVRQRPGARLLPDAYPVLRLASALAALFFVVIFAGELVARSIQPEPMTVSQAQQLVGPVMGMGGGGGGAEGPNAVMEMPAEAAMPESEAALAEGEAAPAEEAMEKAYAPPMPEANAPSLAVTPLGTTILTPTPMAVPVPPGPADAQERSLLEEPLEEPPGEPLTQDLALDAQAEQTLPVSAPTPDKRSAAVSAWSVLRLSQILLALLAVGCGLGAVYLRRSRRG